MTQSEVNKRPKRKHNGKRLSKYGKTRPPELDKFSYELALVRLLQGDLRMGWQTAVQLAFTMAL
jgi:hypothetical protein